ncbi:MAG: TonB-dependent receptor [Alphaproteobacteria bacterium]|nr:TonB-dependent receptor [Alphaproteobacteria bacterium]MBU0792678.1 TonB-dependent receptor [Alphaproteobacteria bacterium]MBU0877317.1 TonB-dependent receptor [Alphaproteobacteria bacterium]MBU1770508.1 TonB-dependent receptor [Alphaproteobacteria bacterium]
MNRDTNSVYRSTRLLLGTALAALIATPVAAQTAEAEAGDEIVVTGYSRSLEEAIEIKRETIGFSDSIVATDIADFPEQNLSEALQRIPGVSIERDKGLGSRVNVRGLPTEFTFVSINKLATASGSGGRDVEFDIFASELIQSVTVQKSPTAADEEGGIAGSVSIRTARPFDNPGLRLVGSAEGAYNSISEKIDPQFSFLASNTFGDFGVLVSVAKQKRTNRTDSNSGINFRPISRWTDRNNANRTQAIAVLARDAGITFTDADKNNIVFLDKVGDRVYLNDQDRLGISGSLQYKPSETFSVSFDAFVGSYDTVEDEYDAAAYSASSNSTLDTIHDYDDTTLAEHGIVVLRDVSYTNTQHEFLSKERINETDYRQFGTELNWETGNWRINALGGYSGAKKTLDYVNLKHVAYAPSRSRYTSNGGETIPSDDPDTIDMYNSPESYLFEAYETTREQIKDDKYAAQVDVSYLFDASVLKRINFGGRYTHKTNEREYGEEKIQGPTRGSTDYVNVRTLADSPLENVIDMVGGKAYQARDLSWSQISNDHARSFFRPDGFVTPFDDGQYYKVREETLAAYGMMDFEFDIAVPVFVNIGARYVRTTVRSEGFHQVQNSDGSTGYTDEPVASTGRYEKLLPAFNAHAELTDSLRLRAAASQTLIRPALTDLAYKRTASWNSFRFTDGNPNLKPTYADQWEIGVEQYLGRGGILSASYFWKEIKGVVQNELTGVVPDVTKYNANGTIDGVYDFDVYQPVNADGSYKVSGVELNAVLPLGLFVHWLDGFGINANYTFLDSSLTGESDLDIPTSPIGLADNTYNATVFYDKGPFSIRLSYNRKGAYVERIERNMYPVYRDAYGQFDIAASYQLTRNFRVELQGINIGNEKTTGYTMDPSFPTTYEFSGSRISLGVRGQF